MKKKIFYGIFFISIFLLSVASTVTPVRGYEYGVPDEAIGYESQSEIKIYDEDEWEDHLGKGSSPKDFKDGDVDVVGAKGKSIVTEMETDEDILKFEKVWVFEAADLPTKHADASGTLISLADSTLATPGPYGPLAYFMELSAGNVAGGVYGLPAASNLSLYNTYLNVANAADLLNASILTYDEILAQYSEKYDGTLLTRELWDKTEDEFAAEPDEDEDEVPFLADPDDWLNSWHNVNDARWRILGELDVMLSAWTGWYLSYYDTLFDFGLGPYPAISAADKWPAYQALNGSIVQTINGLVAYMIISQADADTIFSYINISNTVIVEGSGPVALQEDYVAGFMGLVEVIVETIKVAFASGIPDKFGYLLQLLEAGLPCYVPQGDYMAHVIKSFNIDDETLYKIPYINYGEDLDNDGTIYGIPYGSTASVSGAPLAGDGFVNGGDTIYVYAEVDVEWDGSAVVVEINYQDGQLDPRDILRGEADPDELDDWEWVFPYGDTGSQGTVQIKDGDTVFWEDGGVDQIPGFEITIILGASAVAILGLIYVVMKKRKM